MDNNLEGLAKEGEKLFRNWMVKYDANFLYIDNEIESYTPLFKNKIKRPDISNVGYWKGAYGPVDVKSYNTKNRDRLRLT